MAADNELPRSRAEAKAIGSLHYFTGKPCKNGHISFRYTCDRSCSVCKNDKARKWVDENPWYQKQWYQENSEAVSERSEAWRKANPEKVRETTRRSAARRRSTIKGRLENSIRSGIYAEVSKSSKAGRSTFSLLGYSSDELKAHLERHFLPGMSWENYGFFGWHIEHTVPLSAHNYETPDDIDFKRAWSLSNLRPMWATHNKKKGSKLTKPFQPSLLLATNDNGTAPQKETTHGIFGNII